MSASGSSYSLCHRVTDTLTDFDHLTDLTHDDGYVFSVRVVYDKMTNIARYQIPVSTVHFQNIPDKC